LMAVSPLEAHGPHLPLGTDVIIAEKLMKEYCKAITARFPGYSVLLLPSLFAGCDPLPACGSIAIKPKTLQMILEDNIRGLAKQGFKYLVMCDNHGGPGHQMALEKTALKAWRRFRFIMINSFNVIYRNMVKHNNSFLDLTGLSPGECGDDADNHAGTNETALMLATDDKLVKDYRSVKPSILPTRSGLAALIGDLGRLLGRIGRSEMGSDMEHLANLIAWINSSSKKAYLGAPELASREAGERMIRGHVAVTLELLENAVLNGTKPETGPMLWWLRFFRR